MILNEALHQPQMKRLSTEARVHQNVRVSSDASQAPEAEDPAIVLTVAILILPVHLFQTLASLTAAHPFHAHAEALPSPRGRIVL